jgi:hypothetical protein
MNLTPRAQFQENVEFRRFHQELVLTDRFREAIQTSLLEQVMALPHTYDAGEAAAAYHRIMGARDFIQHLLNIAEQVKTPPTPLPTNLDHKVK